MSTEQDLYQRKFAVSSDGDNNASQGDISAGGMYNKNTEWMQNSYTWVSLALFAFFGHCFRRAATSFAVTRSTMYVGRSSAVLVSLSGES